MIIIISASLRLSLISAKLKWMNGEYIKAMDFDKFYEMALPYLQKAITQRSRSEEDRSHGEDQNRSISRISRRSIDFFEEVPEYDAAMYCHKKMKTN